MKRLFYLLLFCFIATTIKATIPHEIPIGLSRDDVKLVSFHFIDEAFSYGESFWSRYYFGGEILDPTLLNLQNFPVAQFDACHLAHRFDPPINILGCPFFMREDGIQTFYESRYSHDGELHDCIVVSIPFECHLRDIEDLLPKQIEVIPLDQVLRGYIDIIKDRESGEVFTIQGDFQAISNRNFEENPFIGKMGGPDCGIHAFIIAPGNNDEPHIASVAVVSGQGRIRVKHIDKTTGKELPNQNNNRFYVKRLYNRANYSQGIGIGSDGTIYNSYPYEEIEGLLPTKYLLTNISVPTGYKLVGDDTQLVDLSDCLTYPTDSYNPITKEVIFYFEKETLPDTISLAYTETYTSSKNVIGTYTGVRIGEYYWMNSPFRDEIGLNVQSNQWPYGDLVHWRNNQQITKSQIDTLQYRYKMFQWSNRDIENSALDDIKYKPELDYFSMLSGNTQSEKIKTFENCYGPYHSRLHIQWQHSYSWQSMQEAGWIQMMEKKNGQSVAKPWGLPSDKEGRQLYAMCGNATMHEVRQYLAWHWKDPKAPQPAQINGINPQFASYHDWFASSEGNIIKHPSSNGYNENNYNRYAFNLAPSGARFNGPSELVTTLITDDERPIEVQYPTSIGDFNGLNQNAAIPMHGGLIRIEDNPRIHYNNTYEWAPIRWCRPLSDEELGYKLYYKCPVMQNNGHNESYLLASIVNSSGGWKKSTDRDDVIENDSLRANRRFIVDNCIEFDIVKLELNDPVPAGYNELPKGYLRGFYVQYFIEYPETQNKIKNLKDLLFIASGDQCLYVAYSNNWQNISCSLPFPRRAVADIEVSKTTEIKVYPTPVKDVLNIESSETIELAQFFNASGKLVRNENNVNGRIDVSSLAKGIYILKLTTDKETKTVKVIKE